MLENTVLEALKARLMDPDLYKVFADAFTAEWNRHQAQEAAGHASRRSELTRIDRQLDRLVDAIADGTPASKVKDKMIALEARKVQLEREITQAAQPAPRLHPNLAEIYRQKVSGLIETLNGSDAEGLREQLRALIDTITLYPEGDGQRIEVRGELATILGLAGSGKGRDATSLSEQIKMVAGTLNRRSHHSTVSI